MQTKGHCHKSMPHNETNIFFYFKHHNSSILMHEFPDKEPHCIRIFKSKEK